MDSTTALATLRKADPSATFDYDHIYDPSGGASVSANSAVGPSTLERDAVLPRDARAGMIDGGIARHHGAFATAALTTKNIAADGDSPPTAHGTAIASLLVGHEGDFEGYVAGAKLFAADVYGGQPSGGGALEIARALDWLAANNVAVVNVSLAGPANAILERAVALFRARGGIIVAAAGNNGAAGAPSYPASYPGVVGVTSVDAQYHLEVDASRDAQFAALGVDVRAAKLDRGFTRFTGTSFAAPVVSARLALLLVRPDPNAAAVALNQLHHAARPLEGSATRYDYLEPPHLTTISAQQ
jgi:subtilisin family serine protease